MAKVNIVREAFLQGVIDTRSDNRIKRSISACINSCDMKLDKMTGSMLATLVQILQMSDIHTKVSSKSAKNDDYYFGI